MDNLDTGILVVVSVLLAFVLGRMLVLWYFKIEERTQLMREQNEILKAILKQLSGTIDKSS